MVDATAYEIAHSLPEQRLRRCLNRFYTGVYIDCNVAIDKSEISLSRRTEYAFEIENFRFLTLTTPPEFCKESLNHAWRLFSLRMKRAGLWGDYYAVREWNQRGTCEHLHVILRVRPICEAGFARVVRNHWTDCVNASLDVKRDTIITNVEPCYSRDGSVKGLANYVAKYLTKQALQFDTPSKVLERNNVVMDKGTDKFDHIEITTTSHDNGYLKRFGRGFWYSQNWIFRGWRLLSKFMWRLGHKLHNEQFVEWRRLPENIRPLRIVSAIVTAWQHGGRDLTWSITLAKEFRQIGIMWDGLKYEH